MSIRVTSRIVDRRTAMTCVLALCAMTGLLLILGGCDNTPDKPAYNNPFDPLGPEAGDPLHILVTQGSSGLTVIWNQLQGFDITTYEVSHSNVFGGTYEFLEAVDATGENTGFYVFPDPEPTQNHYFRVTALNSDGDFSFVSYQQPGSIVTPPTVILGNGDGMAPTRNLPIVITVGQGDLIEVADNGNFTGALQFTAAGPGEPLSVIWNLGAADSNGVKKTVFVRALGTGYESEAFYDTLEVDFSPDIVVSDGSTVASRFPILQIPADGVLQMRFATSEEDLATTPWIAGADTYSGIELMDNFDEQTIYGEFSGDFGFDSPVSELTVSGDPLSDVVFNLDLGGETVTADPVIRLIHNAVATQLRVGEAADFATALWQDYGDTTTFNLSAGAGRKTIYAQYRNDFTDSGILTASVDYIEQPLAVGFLAPAQAAVLTGGVSFQMRGWALAPGGAAIDSVKIDLDDGNGFFDAIGLEQWSWLWDVPVVEITTVHTLRARAWAGTDSVTTQIAVSVDP